MRGRSSEGADFPGADMEVVIIVGLPYPPQTLELKRKMEYYKKRKLPAFEICLSTPAYRQINQTAGRAVRSLNDRALIFLLDDRIHRNRLTSWLKTSLQKIDHEDVSNVVNDYFTK